MPSRDYKIPPAEWPESNPDLEAALGRCLIAWGILERRIGEAIEQVLRIDSDMAMSVTVNLSAGSKIQVFQSLIHTLGPDVFGAQVVDAVDKLAARTDKAVGNYRNFLSHGQPWPVELPEGEMWVWAWFQARKGGVRGKMRKFSVDNMDCISGDIRKLTDEWYRLQLSLKKGGEFLDFMEST